MLLRNQLYAGVVDVPEYGVRGKRGASNLWSAKMTLRKRAARSGFQIFLKSNRASFVSELNRQIELPWATIGRL